MTQTFTVTEVSQNTREWIAQGKYPMLEYRVHMQANGDTTPLLNVEWSRKAESPAPVVGQQVEGDMEDRGPHGLRFKQAPKLAYQGGGGGSREYKADPAKQAAIAMEHAQKVAVDILRLAAEHGQYKPPSAGDVVSQVKTIAASLFDQVDEATK